jgi:hypothetical protein
MLLASAAVLALPLALAASNTAAAAPTFPDAGASTMGPAVIITLTDSGPTLQTLSSQTYDGSDDVEVGLINSSSTTQTSIMLSGSGNGGGLFAFDGDGIANGNYTDLNTGMAVPGNPADTTRYAGPGVTFSGISAAQTSGTVDFSLAPGAFTYFSLEGSPDSITGGGGITIMGGSGGGGGSTGTAVPEPASLALLLGGLSAMGLTRRARRRS